MKSGFGFLNWNPPWEQISRRQNPFSVVFGFRVLFQNPKSGFPNRTFPSPHRSRILRFLQGSVYKIAEILRKYIERMKKDANYICVAISCFFLYMSSWRCFENKRNEICRHFKWKGVNRHVSLDKVQTHTNKGKGNEKRKKQGKRNEEKGKSNDCTCSFYKGYFADSSWPKNFVGHKRSIGGNVFKSHTGQAAFLQSLSCTLGGRIEHIQSRGQKLRYKFVGEKISFNKEKGLT